MSACNKSTRTLGLDMLGEATIGDTVQITHAQCSATEWTVIGIDAEAVTLWANPLPKKMPFSTGADATRFLRLDLSSSVKDEIGIRRGTVKDTVPQITSIERDKLIAGEALGRAGTSKDGDMLSAACLNEYGCNQWPFSPLRAWLNGDFMRGLPCADRLLPIEHDLVLSIKSAQRTGTPIDIEAMRNELYPYKLSDHETIRLYDNYVLRRTASADEHHGKKSEYTYDRITHLLIDDTVSMLSVADYAKYRDYFRDQLLRARYQGDEPAYYWLLDPEMSESTPVFTVKIMTANNSLRGIQTYVYASNARQPHAVCPMIRVKK